MTTISPTNTAAPDILAHEGKGRRRFKIGAGQQLKGGPFTYIALVVVGLGSILPLYWTLVAASHDQQRVLDTPPPLIPGGRLWSNLQAAWEQANLARPSSTA